MLMEEQGKYLGPKRTAAEAGEPAPLCVLLQNAAARLAAGYLLQEPRPAGKYSRFRVLPQFLGTQAPSGAQRGTGLLLTGPYVD